ncbi:hypothetical protein SD70_25970 [Gordoniibacillus kamchatkensis]|uniref:Copper amine oxidase-like N-terminal domain-containing protein n=1 Tax=Gordoniibacillus kamchatkensis TaxID=1590651 RepID=A0ABR5ABX5_9BACL|nr:copper amine oxidase N-terminal domain-containing protein [Paenibacillus sp. VKM B-2647]KIL38492.1 hypothetical protein SD70_25970 [Paenibacillus sp. VKM B-2647]
MKKLIIGIIIGISITATSSVFADSVKEYILTKIDYPILVKGKEYTNADLPALNYQGNTYVPLKAVGDVLGAAVTWNEQLKRVEIGEVAVSPVNGASGASGQGTSSAVIQTPTESKPVQSNVPQIAKNLIFVNNQQVTPEVLYKQGNEFLAPIRLLSESLGVTATWNDSTKQITFKSDKDVLVLTIGLSTAVFNGNTLSMPLPLQIKDGSTLAPMRFVIETFGGAISVDDATGKINIKAVLSTNGSDTNASDIEKRLNINYSKFKEDFSIGKKELSVSNIVTTQVKYTGSLDQNSFSKYWSDLGNLKDEYLKKYAAEVQALNPQYPLSIGFVYGASSSFLASGYVESNNVVINMYVAPNPFPSSDQLK